MEGLLAGEIEITPHIPYFCRGGNKIVKQWEENFDDGHGHTGVRIMIVYKDKNGKLSDPVMRYIKWDK